MEIYRLNKLKFIRPTDFHSKDKKLQNFCQDIIRNEDIYNKSDEMQYLQILPRLQEQIVQPFQKRLQWKQLVRSPLK